MFATVETERLILRPWRDDDIDAYAEIVADPKVMEFMFPPRGHTRAEAEADIARMRAQWDQLGFGHWVVEERSSGRVIGRSGIKRHHDWMLDTRNTEVGWLYARDAWGKGYATEGGRAALEFCFGELDRPEAISITRPENAASRHVMEKLGMACAGERHWAQRNVDVVWYSLAAPTA